MIPAAGLAAALLASTVSLSPVPGASAGQQGQSRTRPDKVLTIVEENHTKTSALRGMPYLASKAHTYGYATAYRAITHPSLPNYLALAGGSTFGVTDDRLPRAHQLSGRSVFDQAIRQGRRGKVYAESMPSNCYRANIGTYAARHNPWTYFSGSTARAHCAKRDVPAGTPSAGRLHRDIAAGRLPAVGMLVPNLCHDAHDCSLGTSDAWLKKWLPAIMRGPDYQAGRLAVIVTFDEDDHSGPNTVLTVVISPYTHGIVSAKGYTHYSWTRYADRLVGARLLRRAADAVSLRRPFHI